MQWVDTQATGYAWVGTIPLKALLEGLNIPLDTQHIYIYICVYVYGSRSKGPCKEFSIR